MCWPAPGARFRASPSALARSLVARPVHLFIVDTPAAPPLSFGHRRRDEMADMPDSKSGEAQVSCRFKSDRRQSSYLQDNRIEADRRVGSLAAERTKLLHQRRNGWHHVWIWAITKMTRSSSIPNPANASAVGAGYRNRVWLNRTRNGSPSDVCGGAAVFGSANSSSRMMGSPHTS